jgi:hypothetical protein
MSQACVARGRSDHRPCTGRPLSADSPLPDARDVPRSDRDLVDYEVVVELTASAAAC